MAVLGNPESFPITADQQRDPLNWYGRTKRIGEQCVNSLADGAFPAHSFLISNLYGEHMINDMEVSKQTVINFFVERAISDETLTVYEPGTQARNFVHVQDVAKAFVRSTERLLSQLSEDFTGTETYEIAGREEMSVMTVAKIVQETAENELETTVPVKLVKNPRTDEAMIEEFGVDISDATMILGWEPTESVRDSILQLIRTL